ncbi:hypothetical protein CAOG_07844 [Capsaspora owczarzaki ATCC 30864]|uniref:hypothetical protein n=1 Tax=Capsaspora owczarzaki (strain ATCC 30864) TaxID=595528 RepID=UPI0001FE3D05|nr:hypothetical protein CAOG_07844 [Capsaspora owczarzaki ATCC 30864]|eukprot:XP_004342918.1 hypothetical protein CAOG_07844 [Capsaspora owczarzaki ATCC 30864]
MLGLALDQQGGLPAPDLPMTPAASTVASDDGDGAPLAPLAPLARMNNLRIPNIGLDTTLGDTAGIAGPVELGVPLTGDSPSNNGGGGITLGSGAGATDRGGGTDGTTSETGRGTMPISELDWLCPNATKSFGLTGNSPAVPSKSGWILTSPNMPNLLLGGIPALASVTGFDFTFQSTSCYACYLRGNVTLYAIADTANATYDFLSTYPKFNLQASPPSSSLGALQMYNLVTFPVFGRPPGPLVNRTTTTTTTKRQALPYTDPEDARLQMMRREDDADDNDSDECEGDCTNVRRADTASDSTEAKVPPFYFPAAGRFALVVLNTTGQVLAFSPPLDVALVTNSLSLVQGPIANVPPLVQPTQPLTNVFFTQVAYPVVVRGDCQSAELLILRAYDAGNNITQSFTAVLNGSVTCNQTYSYATFAVSLTTGSWRLRVHGSPMRKNFPMLALPGRFEFYPRSISIAGLFERGLSFGSLVADIELASYLAAFMLNTNKTLFANVMPYTQFNLERQVTNCFDATVAVEATITSIQEQNVKGIIGPFCSSEAPAVTTVGAVYTVPTLSYSASDASLSNKAIYPYFARLSGGLLLQARLMSETVHYFQWKAVSLFQFSSLRLDDLLRVRLAAYNVRIIGDVEANGFSDLTSKLLLIRAQKCRVILFGGIAGVVPAQNFVNTLISLNMTAPEYTWIMSTSFATPYGTAVLSHPEIFPPLAGSFVFTVYPTYNQTILAEYSRLRFGAAPSTWGAEFATASRAAVSFSSLQYSSLPDLAYEAVLAYAHAVHQLVHVNRTEPTGAAIKDALFNIDYEGLLGHIFLDANGDRQNTFAASQFRYFPKDNLNYTAPALLITWDRQFHANISELYQTPDEFGNVGLHWPNGVVGMEPEDTPPAYVCTLPCINGTCIGPDSCVCTPGWRTETSVMSFKLSAAECGAPICGGAYGSVCVQGTCIAPGQCRCFDGWRGEDCAERIIVLYQRSAYKAPIILAFTLLFSVFALLLVFVLFLSPARRMLVLRSASPRFLILILIGCILAFGSVIVEYPYPVTTPRCVIRNWLYHLGFVLSVGALLFKTWRVAHIYNARTTSQFRKIDDPKLLVMLAGLLFVFVFYLVIWTAVDPAVAELIESNGVGYYRCPTSAWESVISGGELCLLLWGVWVAFKVRKAPTTFHEAKFIGMSIYNWLFTGVLVKAIILSVALNDADTIYILNGVFVFATFGVMMVLVFAPKLYLVVEGKGDAIYGTSVVVRHHVAPMEQINPRMQPFFISPGELLSDDFVGGNNPVVNGPRPTPGSNSSAAANQAALVRLQDLFSRPGTSRHHSDDDDVLVEQNPGAVCMAVPVARPGSSADAAALVELTCPGGGTQAPGGDPSATNNPVGSPNKLRRKLNFSDGSAFSSPTTATTATTAAISSPRSHRQSQPMDGGGHLHHRTHGRSGTTSPTVPGSPRHGAADRVLDHAENHRASPTDAARVAGAAATPFNWDLLSDHDRALATGILHHLRGMGGRPQDDGNMPGLSDYDENVLLRAKCRALRLEIHDLRKHLAIASGVEYVPSMAASPVFSSPNSRLQSPSERLSPNCSRTHQSRPIVLRSKFGMEFNSPGEHADDAVLPLEDSDSEEYVTAV